jgi:hypothetical protein
VIFKKGEIVKIAKLDKNMRIKISKKEWKEIGKNNGWLREAVIPSDGYADGGTPYTDAEMNFMILQDIKKNPNRFEKIQQIVKLYSEIHPFASVEELDTVWNDIKDKNDQEINAYIDNFAINWE